MGDTPAAFDSAVQRFVACDISTQSIVIAAVDKEQQVVVSPRKMTVDRFTQWAPQNLSKTDALVFEASCDAWHWYDLLQPLVGTLTVAHPQKVALIAQTKVKTDGRDALTLARILAANLVPAVWVPPREVRDLRELVAHRRRLIRQRTQARNRLHAVLLAYHLVPPLGDPFAQKNRAWWASLAIPRSVSLRVQHEVSLLQSLAPLIAQVEDELIALSTTDRWHTMSALLIQLPGFGVLSTMVVLSAIGTIARFPSAKHLVGYSGLGAGIYASGKVTRTKTITKQGRRELRAVLVEAAWTAVDHSPFWKDQFARLSVRLGKKKAIVAIARRLLVAIWHVLTKAEADRNAVQAAVGRKLLKWGDKLRAAGRHSLSRKAFVRAELSRLGYPENNHTADSVPGDMVANLSPPAAHPAASEEG